MLSLRFAFRQLCNSPAYTAVALLILALGIGVNSSMFSVLDALLFRSAPFPNPDQIVQLVSRTPQGTRFNYSAGEVREIRGQNPAFEALTTYAYHQYVMAEPDRPTERIRGVLASAEMFDTFGQQPVIGRAFTAEEASPGRNQVVLLSHAFWQQRYGGNESVVGRNLRLDGESVTIIGVMPPRFDYTKLWGNTQLWRPLNYTAEQLRWRDYRVFNLMGRLAPGATPAQIDTGLASVAHQQAQAHPDLYSGLRYESLSLNEALMDDLGRQISWMLMGLAGFVLLIACANLANLQLARATLRGREFAIRSALGASQRRLIAQQLVESMVLACGGGILGLALAWGLNRVIGAQFTLGGTAGALAIELDFGIVALTFILSLLTGVLFGVVPAWFTSRIDANTALKSQARGSTAGRGSQRVRQALIVAEICLALVLLSGAAMMQRGFTQFLQHETGWDSDRILTATLPIPESRFPDSAARIELFRGIERQLTNLPGVEHAAIATSLPVFGYNGERQVLVEGQTPGDAAILPTARHVMVTSSYFDTLGISRISGESFAPDIKSTDPAVIVINESLARQLWPGENPVGKRLGSMDSGELYWAQVIGVVRDVEAAATLGPPSTRFTVYKPLAQEAWGWVNLVVRSPAPASLATSMRRAVLDLDPDLPPDRIATVPQLIDQSQHNLKLAGDTLSLFGLLGLGLAAVGVYGVIANLVAQRTGEFGIRLALGAQPGDIRGIVLRQGMQLGGIGLLLGFGGAFALGRFLNGTMPRLVQLDWLAVATVALMLAVVALLACWLPARRAMRVDPLVALRDE